MFYSPFQQHHSAPEFWVQSAHVKLLLSLSTFQNLLRHTHHHCRCAEFSAFCLLTFQLEKTWEDFILVFQDIYPDVAGIVINKCKKVFSSTRELGIHLTTHITMHQPQGFTWSLASVNWEPTSVVFSFHA